MEGRRKRKRTLGRPPGADGVDTRARILKSAREVFSAYGYDRTAHADVAERAGVTRTAIYHYFRSKPDLYGALFDSIHEEVLARIVAEADRRGKTLRDQVSGLFDTAAGLNAEDPTFARFISTSIVEATRHPEFQARVGGQVEEIRTFLRASVTAAQGRGELRGDVDANSVANMLVAVLWGMGLFAAFFGTPVELSSAIDVLKLLLAGELLSQPDDTQATPVASA